MSYIGTLSVVRVVLWHKDVECDSVSSNQN